MTDTAKIPFEKVKLFVVDIDGVMTDGGMYYTDDGKEFKKFHVHDGIGLQLLKRAGIHVGIITGEDTVIVTNRAKKLRITDVYLGSRDKVKDLTDLMNKHSIPPEQTLFIGDDVLDTEVMQLAGIGVAVKDAVKEVRDVADYITTLPGGRGAVREIADLVLKSSKTA